MNDTRQEAAGTPRSEVTATGGSTAHTLYASTEHSLLGTQRKSNGVRTATAPKATEQKILKGAIAALARRGSRTLSMRDIAHSAHVSRGTLYRYFATKEEVLRAVSEFISTSFEQRLQTIAHDSSDPLERLQAVMALQLELANEKHIARIGEIDPALVLDFLRSHFDRHARAMQQVLTPLFDLVEQGTGITLDRDLFTAALLRVHLSTVVVPADLQWDAFPQVLTELLRSLLCGTRPSKARGSVAGMHRSLKVQKAETVEE